MSWCHLRNESRIVLKRVFHSAFTLERIKISYTNDARFHQHLILLLPQYPIFAN
jgi:hypothetical protein